MSHDVSILLQGFHEHVSVQTLGTPWCTGSLMLKTFNLAHSSKFLTFLLFICSCASLEREVLVFYALMQ